MPPLSENGAEGRASPDVSGASYPDEVDTNLSLSPVTESETTTPASTIDTPSDVAGVKEVSGSGPGAPAYEADTGAETPRKSDVRSGSLEFQLGELQARLKSLETQTQSERNMEKIVDIMEKSVLTEIHPVVGTKSMEFLEFLKMEDPETIWRMQRLLRRRWSGSDEDYVSRAIKVFEHEIDNLRKEQINATSIKETRDILLEKEVLWRDERKELLKKLDELQNHGAALGTPAEVKVDDESDASEKDLTPAPKAELNYVDWQHFNMRYAKGGQLFAIDVLEGDPVLTWGTPKPGNLVGLDNTLTGGRATMPHSLAQEEKSKPRKTKSSTPGQAPIPERIRINSTLILKILDNIRGDSEDSHNDASSSSASSSGEEIRLTPLIMVRPYKSLAYYEKSIRAKFQELETEFGQKISGTQDAIMTGSSQEQETGAGGGAEALATKSDEQAASESGAGGENSAVSVDDKRESTFSLAAYENLGCLVKFMDEHIVKKMTYLSSDRCQTVTFSDVWYLFKPGDEVIEQSGLQAYRIMSISSAPHQTFPPYRSREKFNMEDRAREDTPVVLFCVHVDFDGRELGPRVRRVKIARFDGEKPVAALEVYPLRFTEELGSHIGRTEADEANKPQSRPTMRQRLITRGRLFMSMTKFKHMHYSGLTLDTRDEVDSHVVVDFEEAFTRVQQKETDDSEDDSSGLVYDSGTAQQGWRPKLNNLAGRELEEDFDRERCTAECCVDQNIHIDSDAEKKRNEEYRALLMPEDRQQEPPPTIYPRTLPQASGEEIAASEEDLVIMSHRVFGFILRSRKWGEKLFPPDIRDPRFNNLIKRLQ